MSETKTEQQSLRRVAWCNLWNIARANDTDGMGSRWHLTTSPGLSGRTLCGKSFPAVKGYPSVWRACRRCQRIAQQRGLVDDELPIVPSRDGGD